MNILENYYVAQEIDKLAKSLAPLADNFDRVLIINSDQEEALLLIAGLGHDQQFTYNLDLFAYNNGKIEITDRKIKAVSDDDRCLAVLFNNRKLDQSKIHKELVLSKKLLSKNRDNQLVMISESYINDLETNRYFQYSEKEYGLAVDKLPKDHLAHLAKANDAYCADFRSSGLNAVVLNYANLFGPSIVKNDTPLLQVCKSAVKNKSIKFNEDDKLKTISYTYILDLLFYLQHAIDNKTKDPMLNVSSYNSDIYKIKSLLSNIFFDYKVHYATVSTELEYQKFSMIQALNIHHNIKRSHLAYRCAIEATAMSLLDNHEVDSIELDKVERRYNGKLNTIRNLELDILSDVDRICKLHNLKYFLIGGSMLGAIRHEGFIPWDDDLDIGFLREDYDKFRKIAPKELKEKFYYQTYRNSDGSHYIFDKIRVKGTTFSTAWSSNFNIEDGVFLDVLVFDKTSNFRIIQNIHVKMILVVKRAINIKWINYPRKNVHYTLSVIALPFMRLIPFSILHAIFEWIIKLYRGSSRSRYVLDSVGMNVKKGAFPLVWLEDLAVGKFEGEDVPILKNYDDYLKLWYGDNYAKLLPPRSRNGHKIVEMDLGEYAEN